MTNVPRQQGERARVKVVRGPDYGSVYVITGSRATIGRGEDNDIVISDLKASRQHVEIQHGSKGWSVRDMNSANGILLNGKAAAGGALNPKDTLTVGETVLEFVAAEQGTLMLVAPARSMEQIDAERVALEQQRKRVQSIGKIGGNVGGANGGAVGSSPDQRKKLLIFAAAGVLLVVLFGGNEGKKPAEQKGANKPVDATPLDQYLPSNEVPAIQRSAEMFFKTGFREYKQGNYLRAKTQFETVLQMAPGHPLATLYLQNSETKIQDLVKAHLENGRRALDAGKLKESRGHFEATLRLLFRDQTNPSYIEAKEQLQKVLQEMRAADGIPADSTEGGA